MSIKNKKLISAHQTFDPEKATRKAEKQMAEFKEEAGVAQDAKVYVVLGRYRPLREELNRRGWVEHEVESEMDENGEPIPFTSLAFDFIYARLASDVFQLPMAPH